MAEQSGGYSLPTYPFVEPPELATGERRRYPVVIVGGGLAGLTAACDLASRGIAPVVLDEDDTIGVRGASSRGICYAQKSLEIFDRLGTYDRIRAKGATWSVGKTFSGSSLVYSFDLQRASSSKQPPFINLQQFYIEWFLVDRINELGVAELRWKNRATRVSQNATGVSVSVQTPAGSYELEADWLIDASGVNSAIRDGFQLDTHMAKSADRWCITDVRFKKPLPVERWTWVQAPFNQGRAVWQHLMGDGVWRLDYQMAPDSDPDHISRPEVAHERLAAHLGPEVEYELVWVGPYSYRHILLDSFRHGRVFFIGDAAHVVNPFGARGGNSGIADAENLAWKLSLVLEGRAPERLLDSYSAERQPAAAENFRVSLRTGRFLAPESGAEHTLRNAAVGLAREYSFARALVNTGRMSVASVYPASVALPDGGRPVQNVPVVLPNGRAGCLVDLLRGTSAFLALWFAPRGADAAGFDELARSEPLLRICTVGERVGALPAIGDPDGKLAAVLDAEQGGVYLVRPDMYLGAAIPAAIPEALRCSLDALLCKG